MMSLPIFFQNMVWRSNLRFLLVFILFLPISCQKSNEFLNNPEKFLEIKDFPSYILKISYNGVNGSNLLQGLREDTLVDIKGIYVKGKGTSFLRTFDDSELLYVPLKGVPEFNSEASLVEIKGRVRSNGEAYLKGIEVKSLDDIEELRKAVEHEYPLLLEKIKGKVRNSKSNNRTKISTSASHLSLDIKDWHLAARRDEILVFGRTYDLMYEFDIGILVKKSGDTYSLEKIYAREFFKGE